MDKPSAKFDDTYEERTRQRAAELREEWVKEFKAEVE